MIARQLPLYLLAFTAIFLVRNQPFFWDTIQLASKHAHFFYETDFQSLILPELIDSGHPPAFGMYLAAVWKVFGKSLPASHFAMLPFLWGIVFFLFKIGEKIAGKTSAPWLVLLCFADPVLAAQSILVSPDVALVCFFLMSLWAVLEKQQSWLAAGVIGLGLVSMRGMMLGAGLYLFSLFLVEKISLKTAIQNLLPFLPGGLIAAGFLFYHWQQTGWIGYHAGSTWAPSFERVDFQGFIKNIAVLGWRVLDFGRVFVWAGLAVVAFLWVKKRGWKLPAISRVSTGWQLIGLIVLAALATVPTQLFYKGLLAHRYLLPVFVSLNFLFFYLIFNGLKTLKMHGQYRTVLFIFAVAGLLTGNLWIYPKKISQGWDSTLAHLPWYDLQEQAEDFIQNAGIHYNKVGTAFPNIGPRENIELNGVGEGFIEKVLAANCYVLYSNIMNDFTDAEIDELEGRWPEVFKQEKRGVCVILYKNPNEQCEN
jgi:hypothetical protein